MSEQMTLLAQAVTRFDLEPHLSEAANTLGDNPLNRTDLKSSWFWNLKLL